ncbi:hypothetical protein PO909_005118, partial [Leuciscus waleckii]
SFGYFTQKTERDKKNQVNVIYLNINKTGDNDLKWKHSIIRPVPKKPRSKSLNDFRPVALTPILAKCMEKVVRKHLTSCIKEQFDPLQFAYRTNRGTDDATLTMVNMVSSHLQQNNMYAQILFIDFNSAFNTMHIHILLQRLLDLGVNGGLVHWVNDFLTDRPQRISCTALRCYWEIVLNTGAPQGCVLSTSLFSVYTNEMTLQDNKYKLFKYADDMALVGIFYKNDAVSDYFAQVSWLEQWCRSSFLSISAVKTMEIVNSFKYLGTHVDDKLSFTENTDCICKKAGQRMFLIRKLKEFDVSQNILEKVYVSLIESILVFNISVWFGHLTLINKNKLGRIVKTAGKVIGRQQKSLDVLYSTALYRKALSIIGDKKHPLHIEFELLPSGRRHRVPLANKNIYK